jgi:alkylation response protein AidB-like acyl-CoA dehydrogenase
MTEYTAPLREMRFVLNDLVGMDRIASLPGYEHAEPDLIDAILEEAGKFAANILSPLNQPGDKEGARLDADGAHTAAGFADAYRQFVDGGWNALGCDPEYGGQGLPAVLGTAVKEMWNAANMAFSLCPLLTTGAIEALHLVGTDAQKKMYLPKMVGGTWTGTMNLTEPQAGSDLAAIRTRAVPEGDHYRIYGQKIFITYGDHDMTENIVHLVLGRLPDAPEGVRGISLFVVPKFLVNADGSLGVRNDAYCVGLEHKLGIHASPTATMAYGDKEGAIGTLVGEANRGLEYMFIMMKRARFDVGLQGVAISERAYQHALDYARNRVQGNEAGVRGGGRVAIIKHPDVRRMLMSMKSRTEAMRALAYVVAAALDIAQRHPDASERARNQAMVDLLIPVVKGWSTESSIDVASIGVQIHGGMGFIEQTGAAQYLRDARILAIYEGTTGIQANDLIGRKILRDQGATARIAIAEMRDVLTRLGAAAGDDFAAIRTGLAEAIALLEQAIAWVIATNPTDPRGVLAGAVPLLNLFGIVAGGWQSARAALAAADRLSAGDNDEPGFYRAKIGTARFYADHVLSQAAGLAHSVMHGSAGVLALEEDDFAA